MRIPAVENEVVLDGKRGDPEIVGGDWLSATFQLTENRRVLVRRGIRAVNGPHARLVEQFMQNAHLGIPSTDGLRSHTNLRQNDERDHKQRRPFKDFNDLRVACTEVDKTVGIDENSHFQSSGEILSMADSLFCHAARSTLPAPAKTDLNER